jgi:hypothetical protein
MSTTIRLISALGFLLATGTARAAIREVSVKTALKEGRGKVEFERGEKKVGLRVKPGQTVLKSDRGSLKTAASAKPNRILFVVKTPGKYVADLGGKKGRQELEVLASGAGETRKTKAKAETKPKAEKAKRHRNREHHDYSDLDAPDIGTSREPWRDLHRQAGGGW